jgi:hypothetical protein
MNFIIIKNKLDCINIRKSCKQIIFDNSFDDSIDSISLPDHIESIKFGHWFNQSIVNVEWSKSLKTIIFGDEFFQLIDELPDTIEFLELGYNFNLPINKLPNSLHSIVFGKKFNQSLEIIKLPKLLKSIIFADDYDQQLENIKLSTEIVELHLGKKFNTNKLGNLPDVKILKIVNISENLNNLPISLEYLKINQKHKQFIDKVPFGCVVEYFMDLNEQEQNSILNTTESTDSYDSIEEQYIDSISEVSSIGKHNSFDVISNNKINKIRKTVIIDMGSKYIISAKYDTLKIKGFIVKFDNLSKLKELKFIMNIGGGIIFEIPFKLMSLLSKNIDEHSIDVNTAYLEFDHNFYIEDEINLRALRYHQVSIETNKMIDFNLNVVLEYFVYYPSDFDDRICIQKMFRQITHYYTNNVKIHIGLPVQGVFIDKNLDDINNLTIIKYGEFNDSSIIKYDKYLVKIYGKKINNKLCYISFNDSKDYNLFDPRMIKKGGPCDFIINVNEEEYVNLYFIIINYLNFKNGMCGYCWA